jgi:hypothetical protein
MHSPLLLMFDIFTSLSSFLQSLANDTPVVRSAYSQEATFSAQIQCLCKNELNCQSVSTVWCTVPARNLQSSVFFVAPYQSANFRHSNYRDASVRKGHLFKHLIGVPGGAPASPPSCQLYGHAGRYNDPIGGIASPGGKPVSLDWAAKDMVWSQLLTHEASLF